jgi:hypothetical protein
MKRIFAFFGFVPVTSLVTAKADLELATKALEEKTLEYNKLFDPDLIEMEMTYNEYALANGRTLLGGLYNTQLFLEYYDKYKRNQYAAYKMRCLCSQPPLFAAFMLEFSKFDWEGTCKYMNSVNWNWDKNRPLTTADLIDCVITLLPDFVSTNNKRQRLFDFNKLVAGGSTGGFTVLVGYKDADLSSPYCTIEFDKTL